MDGWMDASYFSTYPAGRVEASTHATLLFSSSESSRTCLVCSSSVRELKEVAVWSKSEKIIILLEIQAETSITYTV